MKPKDIEVLRQILEFEKSVQPGSLASWAGPGTM